MTLSTEFFVMVIFIAGGPFFYVVLRSSELPGRRYFMGAYVFLLLSNIFTVVEEFWLNSFFNTCEHVSIALGSVGMLATVVKLTRKSL
ncbi:MAG: hypothetical protein LJE94_00205 [Deltaproteobacteria bacterium]|jgi:hypothetical protein|nr:hypothetical protein [Deltaproteobacteria bacterium]